MSFTGLDALAHKAIDGLSKGMKQRLCLGRSLIHDPAVMVLDEPAAGLDPRARIELREMIRALANEGKAILISSHILTELAEISDIVGIIERGSLVAVGSVDEIQGGIRGEQNLVEVRVLEGVDGLPAWLDNRPSISEITVDGSTVRFVLTGDEAAEAEILKEMINGGFRVIAFGARRRTLEDVFMHVTQGLVQ
jgi:ABC-2 type transport system ATP-binding protein